MDDEAPLAALASSGKPASFDDDTPLAALASKSKPKVQKSIVKPGRLGMAPGLKGKGKVKGKGKGSSSSSESGDSSSGSSSSDSEDGGGRRRPARKKKAADDGMLPDETMKRAKDKRSTKEKLVADVLCRWWYAAGTDWPVQDEEYYAAELKKRQLRKVEVTNWEWEDDMDAQGFRKCYALNPFYGVFRDSAGALIDLRPKGNCPSYENYMNKDQVELYELLEKALEGQLEALKKSVYDESKLQAELSGRLARVREIRSKTADLQGRKTVLPKM